MGKWLQYRGRYLDILLEMEGQPSALNCSNCSTRLGDIKSLTAPEQTYFVNPAALRCTRDLHSITCFIGMESIMLQHPCILWAFYCALGMRGNPVQRQWRYGYMECLFSYLCSYSY